MGVGDAYALRNAVRSLETDEQPPAQDLAWAPVIDNWKPALHTFPLHEEPGHVEVTVTGVVAGRAHMRDGGKITTSAVAAFDFDDKWVRTQNTLYRLGYPWHERPLVLRVAEQRDWSSAAAFLLGEIGWHTLTWGGGGERDVGDFAALEAAQVLRRELEEDVRRDWSLAREAAVDLGTALRSMGRLSAARAASPLSARARSTKETSGAWYDLKVAAGPDSSGETDALLLGWHRLSKNDYDAADLQGTLQLDAIAAAHHLAPKLTAKSEDMPRAPDVHGDDGVVVLAQIGGVGTEKHKEAKRILGDVVGKRLPLASPPDVGVVRAALLAEFPHLAGTINVLVGDLRAGRHPQFRNSVLVGPAGAGKTRFIKRLSGAVGLPVAVYGAANAWDGMIGGTAKGWSSGHPAYPVELLLSRRRADAVVLVDEIEKAGGSDQNGRLSSALLPMLEKETSMEFDDKYLSAPVDISHVSWLATANSVDGIPEPLRDRLRILRVAEPTIAHLIPLARTIVAELARESGDDIRFYPDLSDVELAIVERLWRGRSIRRLRRIIEVVVRRRETNPRN